MTRQRQAFVAIAAIWLGLALALAVVGRVRAECDGPVPSFRDHAGSAMRIVIGDVTAVDPTAHWRDDEGRSSRFTLRVRHFLRGEAETVMRIRDEAYLPCSDHIIVARAGDRIALALDATGFPAAITFSTVAWIRGTAADLVIVVTIQDARSRRSPTSTR